jgi:hypothetical protein
MNYRNNFRTITSLDRIGDEAPSRDLLDRHERDLMSLEHSRLDNLDAYSDVEVLHMLALSKLWFLNERSGRATQLHNWYGHDLKPDASCRKDYHKARATVAKLKVEGARRADLHAKAAKALRAALK